MTDGLEAFRQYQNIFDFLNHGEMLENKENLEDLAIYSWIRDENPITVMKLEEVDSAIEFIEREEGGSKELRNNILCEDSPETAFAEIILVGKLRKELVDGSVTMNPNFVDLEKEIECNPDILVELSNEKIVIEVTSTSATERTFEDKPKNKVFDIGELRKGNHFSNKLTDKLNQLEELWETEYRLAVAFHTTLMETDQDIWFKNFIQGDFDSVTIYHDDGDVEAAEKNFSPPAIRMEENSKFLNFAILFSFSNFHLYSSEKNYESSGLKDLIEFDSVNKFDSKTFYPPEEFPK